MATGVSLSTVEPGTSGQDSSMKPVAASPGTVTASSLEVLAVVTVPVRVERTVRGGEGDQRRLLARSPEQVGSLDLDGLPLIPEEPTLRRVLGQVLASVDVELGVSRGHLDGGLDPRR